MKPDIYWIGGIEPARLAIVARPRGGDWLADELVALRESGIDLVVSLLTMAERDELGLTAEAELAAAAGLAFLSLPIADMGVPPHLASAREVLERTHAAVRAGMSTMVDDGAVKCRAGLTSAAEVLRVTTIR